MNYKTLEVEEGESRNSMGDAGGNSEVPQQVKAESFKSSSKVWAVDFMFLIFKIAEAILAPAVRLFIYEGVCLNLYPEDEYGNTCSHLDGDMDKEIIVQNSSAWYMVIYKLLINFPAMVVVLCCGAWSDRAGRTAPIILTCLGTVLGSEAYIVSISKIFDKPPSLPLILLGSAIRGLFGRSAVMTMAVNSFVSDNSPVSKRTLHLSTLVAMSHFGYLLGSLVAGYILEKFGYNVVFIIVICIDTVCVFVAYVTMMESNREHSDFKEMMEDTIDEEDQPASEESALLSRVQLKNHRCNTISASEDFVIVHLPYSESDDVTPDTVQFAHKITSRRRSSSYGDIPKTSSNQNEVTVCDQPRVVTKDTDSQERIQKEIHVENFSTDNSSSVFNCFRVLTKRRPGRQRRALWTLFLLVYLNQMNKSGETDVYLLYVKRSPLNISNSMYGYLLAANYTALGLFAFVVPKSLSACKCSSKDSTLALVGILMKIGSLIFLCFAHDVESLLITAVLAGPLSLTVSSLKSSVSKIAQTNEMGQTFSLLSSGETLSNLIGSLIYTGAYTVTCQIHPGIAFMVEAGIYFLMFVLVLEHSTSDQGPGCCSCHFNTNSLDDPESDAGENQAIQSHT